jgi:hypothetical protein
MEKPTPDTIFIGYFGKWIPGKVNAAELTVTEFQKRHQDDTLAIGKRKITLIYLEMKRTAPSVTTAVTEAQKYERAIFIGETVVRDQTARLERNAYKRETPPEKLLDSAKNTVMRLGQKDVKLPTGCPVDDMAKAAKIAVSDDPGRDFCNHVYYLALEAKPSAAVFLHVHAGWFGRGRHTELCAEKLELVLEAWVKSGK